MARLNGETMTELHDRGDALATFLADKLDNAGPHVEFFNGEVNGEPIVIDMKTYNELPMEDREIYVANCIYEAATGEEMTEEEKTEYNDEVFDYLEDNDFDIDIDDADFYYPDT